MSERKRKESDGGVQAVSENGEVDRSRMSTNSRSWDGAQILFQCERDTRVAFKQVLSLIRFALCQGSFSQIQVQHNCPALNAPVDQSLGWKRPSCHGDICDEGPVHWLWQWDQCSSGRRETR